MKTHKFFLNLFPALAMIFLFSGSLQAQGTYLSLSGGYGIATASMMIGANFTGSSYKEVKGTFGEGTTAAITIGKKLSTNVALEMGIAYLFGTKKIDDLGAFWLPVQEFATEIKTRIFRFSPVLKINTEGKNKLYLKTGLIVAVGEKITVSTDQAASITYPYYFESKNTTEEFTGGIAIGFTGGAGIEFSLRQNVSLFSELSFIAESWAPSHSKITRYIINGQDQLPMMTISDKETEYVNEIALNSSNNSSEPKKQFKAYFPMSSIALNIGIKFSFQEKTKTSKSVTN